MDVFAAVFAALLAVGANVFYSRRQARLRASRPARTVLVLPTVEETAASIERFQEAVRRFERVESLHAWTVVRLGRKVTRNGP